MHCTAEMMGVAVSRVYVRAAGMFTGGGAVRISGAGGESLG